MFGHIILESTTTTGTGNITLAGPDSSYAGFFDQFSAGDRVYYSILTNSSQDREIGYGTLSGTSVLERTEILATLVSAVYDDTSPAAITLSGTSKVACADEATLLTWIDDVRKAPAGDAGKVVVVDAAGGGILSNTLSAGTW